MATKIPRSIAEESAFAFTLVKSLKASNDTPAEDPEMDVLVNIILLFGGSFCVRTDPEEPDNKVTLKKFVSSRFVSLAYLKF